MGTTRPDLKYSAGSGVLSTRRASGAPNTQCSFRRKSLQSSASFLLVVSFHLQLTKITNSLRLFD